MKVEQRKGEETFRRMLFPSSQTLRWAVSRRLGIRGREAAEDDSSVQGDVAHLRSRTAFMQCKQSGTEFPI